MQLLFSFGIYVFILINFTACCIFLYSAPLSWWVFCGDSAAGPLNPVQGGFYLSIVLLKGKQTPPIVGQWGCVSLLISGAQSLYSAARYHSKSERKLSSQSHVEAEKNSLINHSHRSKWKSCGQLSSLCRLFIKAQLMRSSDGQWTLKV